MTISPAIFTNGGRLPEAYIEKVRALLPEEHELLSMLEEFDFDSESAYQSNEALRDQNLQQRHEIFEEFCRVSMELAKGNNFDGNLADYFALRRHDHEAFEKLTQAARRDEELAHLLYEFDWILDGGHVSRQVWDMESPNPKLVPSTYLSFI